MAKKNIVVNKFDATVDYIIERLGAKLSKNKIFALAETLLKSGDVTPKARYERLAKVAREHGFKHPYAIARSLLPTHQQIELNEQKRLYR